MDKVCSIYISDNVGGIDSFWSIDEHIKENCERNNIINFYGDNDIRAEIFNYGDKGEEPLYGSIPFDSLIKSWCRFDRNVFDNTSTYGNFRSVSCVLYSINSREFIK